MVDWPQGEASWQEGVMGQRSSPHGAGKQSGLERVVGICWGQVGPRDVPVTHPDTSGSVLLIFQVSLNIRTENHDTQSQKLNLKINWYKMLLVFVCISLLQLVRLNILLY